MPEKRPRGRPRKRALGPHPKRGRGRPSHSKFGLILAPGVPKYLLAHLASIERRQATARANGKRLSFRKALMDDMIAFNRDWLAGGKVDPDIELYLKEKARRTGGASPANCDPKLEAEAKRIALKNLDRVKMKMLAARELWGAEGIEYARQLRVYSKTNREKGEKR